MGGDPPGPRPIHALFPAVPRRLRVVDEEPEEVLEEEFEEEFEEVQVACREQKPQDERKGGFSSTRWAGASAQKVVLVFDHKRSQ